MPTFPDRTIPGVPVTGNCCLTRYHKNAIGNRSAVFGSLYACAPASSPNTSRGGTQFILTLRPDAHCDELTTLPEMLRRSSTLDAKGNTIIRGDRFAHFFGQFIITTRDDAGSVVRLFTGRMEALDRVGTHHPPFGTESCDTQSHLEGWLVGRGVGPAANFTLRALIVATTNVPATAAPAPVNGSIDGVLIQCP